MVSVRELVEFVLREGDIDNRTHINAETAMQAGGRIHRMIQKKQGPSYHAEVPLSYTIHSRKYDLTIEGRADGIVEGDIVLIDEIKATYKNLEHLDDPVAVHLAQAKVYAAIYLITHELNKISVRLSYCNLDTEKMKYFEYLFTSSQITSWFDDVIAKYQKFTDFAADWRKERNSSIKSLSFPFPYRKGQKELAAGVYRTIVHGKKLFLEAPTGTGKTITTLFPSIVAIGQEKAEKIFYLTAKTITGQVAADTVKLLRIHQNLRLKTITLTAKDKICFLEKSNCNPESCEYAKGHFNRINEALYDLLIHEDDFSRDTIRYYAQKHKVCPFEFSLDMSLFADMVVCDYNYVFDPFVYLKRFFAEGKKDQYIFLIDEAHNLLDRGQNIYSSELYLEDAQNLKDITSSLGSFPFKAHLTRLCNLLDEMYDDNKPKILFSIEPLTDAVQRLYSAISSYLDENRQDTCRDDILDYYFKLSKFLVIYDMIDEHYRIYQEVDEQKGFRVRVLCADPSSGLGACMQKAVSTILFSATFLPIQYYKKLLGGTDEDFEMYATSVFDPEKRELILAKDVTTRYVDRGPVQYSKIAEYIHLMVNSKKGNYMAFFPSHAFLENVYEMYMSKYAGEDDVEILIQGEGMSDEEREEFLARFSEGNSLELSNIIQMDVEYVDNTSVLGFCVLGGIFGEGIDLKKDSLIGSIIVGCGIPLVCNEREILRHYFDDMGQDGFSYAYRYPGMNKVLQAAGRVIRTKEDEGVVALLDNRFLQWEYKTMFPREWNKIDVVSSDMVERRLEDFWNKRNNSSN